MEVNLSVLRVRMLKRQDKCFDDCECPLASFYPALQFLETNLTQECTKWNYLNVYFNTSCITQSASRPLTLLIAWLMHCSFAFDCGMELLMSRPLQELKHSRWCHSSFFHRRKLWTIGVGVHWTLQYGERSSFARIRTNILQNGLHQIKTCGNKTIVLDAKQGRLWHFFYEWMIIV